MSRVAFFDCESSPTRHDERLPTCVVVALAFDDGPVTLHDPREGRRLLQEHHDAGGILVGHAVAFDLDVIGIRVRDWARVFCTQIRGVIDGAASGLHESQSSGLDVLAKKQGITLTGKGTIQLSFGGHTLATLSPEQRTYAAEDVIATRAVWKAQGGERRRDDEERQTMYALDVFRMARRGVRLDVERVEGLVAAAVERVRAAREPLVALGLMHKTGTKKAPKLSVKQAAVQAVLCELGIRLPPKSRQGDDDWDPDEDTLSAESAILRASGDRRLVALADFKDAQKFESLARALYEYKDKRTGTVERIGEYARAFWKPMVASGRIASSRPNFTQIPKGGGLRECVIPDDGDNVLVVADVPELEFRAWADVCNRELGWSTAADAYNEGRSPHLVLAGQLLGLTYAETVERYKAGDPIVKDARQDAKAGNYGFIGGMGPRTCAKTYGLTEARARGVQAAWRRTWPESKRYFRGVKAGAAGMHRVGDKMISFYRVRLPWSGRERLQTFTRCCNFKIQGTGADITKGWLHRLTKDGVDVRIKMHDEMVAVARRQDAEEVAHLMGKRQTEAGLEVCPSVPWPSEVHVRERWGK